MPTLRARLRCPVQLLIVCPDAAVATRCATPIRLGVSGSQVAPEVVGPDLVPVVTDHAQARRAPELAVLSALAHGGGPEYRAALAALLPAPPSSRDLAQLDTWVRRAATAEKIDDLLS